MFSRPAIVLADEPTGALDSKTSVQVMELLKEVKRMLDEELFIVENIDATIIAQRPKMAPYLQEMRENIAKQ